ncbi:MAG: LuxR C-terminal-related transcriptional regulator [Aliidongia sp.]
MGVVPTSIAPPRYPTTQIERRRIVELVDAIDESRVTTLYAPAGYGKTVALLQVSRLLSGRGRPVLWLAARAGIDTTSEFVSALKAAAVVAGLDWSSLSTDGPINELLALIATKQSARPVLVIDDAQRLPPEILALLTRIVESARDAITTIIASRSLATIPIARLRSLGYLTEIGIADLRFSTAEAVEFLAKAGQGPIDSERVRKLVEETDGWAAGIVMAGPIRRDEWRLKENTTSRSIGLRREIETYFAEEVMAPQTGAVRDFLVSTAVLDELTPGACAAMTGCENSRRTLEAVEEAGLFLEATDPERVSYRYHPLFREVILRRLYDRDPARAAELHFRASRYFAGIGKLERAIEHAELSRDRNFLADQLDALAEPLTYTGYLYRIDQLARDMPSSLLASRPMLLLALAWRRIRSLAFSSAEALISAAEACLQQKRDDENVSECWIRDFEHTIEHRRIMLDAARDDMQKVEQRAEALLVKFGDDQPYLSCTLLAQLMTARRELYHFHDMLKLEAETRRALSRPGSDFASIALKASVAGTLMVQGKIETAQQWLEEAFDLARSIQGEGSGLAALPALPLAELHYDRGDLAKARALVDAHLPLARQWGFVDQLAAGHIVHARLLAAEGDLAGALKSLDETHLLAIECGLDRLRAYVVGEQVRMLIHSGEPKLAAAAFQADDLAPASDPFPTMNPTRQHESVAISWIRLEMQSDRLVRARKVAKRWSEFAHRNRAIRSAVAFELLLAEIAVLGGDRSEARRSVREAVTLAAPAGWTQIFLDEGDAIGSLLVEAYADGPALNSAPDQLAARLVAAFSGSPTVEPEDEYGLGSKLVNREFEILRMVAGGLRNREIGNRLGLTEGTVKWYMQQIYDKLGVRRRPQAVMRARQLGILA